MPLKDLIATVAEALVDDPDAVEVDEVEDDRGVIVELRVSHEDIGKVMGGNALRILGQVWA